MSVEIEGLEFQVEAKSDKGADGIDKLANSFKNLKSAIKGGTNLNGSIKQLEKLNQALSGLHTDKLESLGKAMESLNKAGNIKIPASVPKRISEIGNAMKSISQSDIDRMESMSRALQGMQGLQNVRVPQVNTGGTGSGTPNPADINTEPASSGRSTSHSGIQTEDVSNTGGADNGMSHADSQLQEVTRSAGMARTALSGVKKVIGEIGGLTGISYVGQQIGSLPHKIGQALGSLRTMYSEFKKSGGILGAFGRTIKAVATNLGSKLAAGMKQVTSSLGNAFTSKVHNATSALGSFLSSIKRIALYRMIRFAMSQLTQCFKDGINNLYNYSALMGGTFANSMNSLATNAQYLKNSMGAMAAPLINALAPAIDFVIGKVVALFNILNQLFARLTGSKTYTAAKKVAATYGGAAKDAAGTASKAAKKAADEIKRYTLGFDELNILGDKNKDSSGSGGGGGGGGGASTPDYGSMFEELPIDNSISEFADKLKEAFEAGDWKELGTILGNKFNEIVDSIDWAGFGKKVGYGINGAVQTAYWFLKTADFKNLGNHVAEFLNSALSEIDFTFVGRLLVRGFTAGLDFLRGALGGLNWKLVGKSFGDFLRGAFNEMQEWIAGIDWSGAAHALWQNTKDCIAGIDFASLAQSFFKLLGTAMGAAVSFIATIVSDIWKDITGYFQKYLTNDDGTKKTGIDWVKGICKGIVEGVKSIGTWIYDNVFKPFIDGFKSAFGIHSPSTVMAEQGGYIVEGLLKGIKDGIGNVLSFIGDFLIGIKDKISDAWDKIKSTASEKWGQIKSVLSGAWENIKTTAGDIWGKISSTISGIWGGIKTKASETWSGLKTTISQKWSEIKTNTSQTWENIKTTLGNTWQNVKTTASTTWTNIKTSISTAWSNVKSNTSTVWSNIKSNLSTTWTNVKTTAGTTWTNLKSTISTAWGNVKTNTSTVWSGIKSSLGTTWSGVKSTASSTWSTLKSTISTKWNEIKSNTSSTWSTLNSSLRSSWSIVSDTFLPTISSVTLADKTNTPVPASWNKVFVQNQSGIRISAITCAASQGATVKRIKLRLDTQYTEQTYSASSLPQINRIINSGSLECEVTITDSRGRTCSKTCTVNVLPYDIPKFTLIESDRCNKSGEMDNDGTYFLSQSAVEFSSCTGLNSITITAEYKKTDTSEWLNKKTIKPGSNVLGGELDTEFSYDVRYVLKDAFSTVTYIDYVSTAIYLMHFLHGGRGVAFGQKATMDNTLDCAFKALFREDVTIVKKDGTQVSMREVLEKLGF